MKLTNKQYLVDITLKSLQVKQTKQPSKISCQVHFADNYLKIKLQPVLKNGVANFYQERIRIPYAPDVALVFKMFKNDKKQVYLGHLPLDLEECLKRKQFQFQVNGENLFQTDSKVYFQCRIIDKALFNSDSEDQIIEEVSIQSPTIKQTPSQKWPKLLMNRTARRIQSQMQRAKTVSKRNFAFLKKPMDLNVLISEEYFSQLQTAKDILNKKQMLIDRFKIRSKYSRDEQGFLRSDKISDLQNKLLKLREQERIGNFLIYSILAGVCFVIGFMTA